MTPTSSERKARAGLPIVRLMQAHMPLPVARWLIRQGNARVRLAANLRRAAVSADGAPCEWLIPEGSPDDQVLLYLHGGGFVYPLTPPHIEMAAHLAKKMGIRALLVDYRVAPDHPFPAALDDCITAYGWLLKQGIRGQNIVIGGDSAGGNLTLTTLMKLRDRGERLPAAAACLSPVADLTGSGHRSGDANDPLLHPKAMRFYNASYIGRGDPTDALISPVFGDWRGLPPLLVHAGEDEVLCEDAVRVAELARAAGVDVRLEIYPRMWHVWQLNLALPQARQSLDDIAQFFVSHLENA